MKKRLLIVLKDVLIMEYGTFVDAQNQLTDFNSEVHSFLASIFERSDRDMIREWLTEEMELSGVELEVAECYIDSKMIYNGMIKNQAKAYREITKNFKPTVKEQ